MTSRHTIESLADSVHILIVVLVVLILVIALVVVAQVFNITASIIDFCASRKQKGSHDGLSGVTVVKNRKDGSSRSKKRDYKQSSMSCKSGAKTSERVSATRTLGNSKRDSKQTPIGKEVLSSSNKSAHHKPLNKDGDKSAMALQLSSTEVKKDHCGLDPSTDSALKPKEKKDLLVEFSPTTVNDPIGRGSVVAMAADHKLGSNVPMKTALREVYPDEQPIMTVKSDQEGSCASTQSAVPSINNDVSSSWTPISQSDFCSVLSSVDTASLKTASPPKTAVLKGQSNGKEGNRSDTSSVPVVAAENVLVESKIQPGSMV